MHEILPYELPVAYICSMKKRNKFDLHYSTRRNGELRNAGIDTEALSGAHEDPIRPKLCLRVAAETQRHPGLRL
jgi:hypothetical protein